MYLYIYIYVEIIKRIPHHRPDSLSSLIIKQFTELRVAPCLTDANPGGQIPQFTACSPQLTDGDFQPAMISMICEFKLMYILLILLQYSIIFEVLEFQMIRHDHT